MIGNPNWSLNRASTLDSIGLFPGQIIFDDFGEVPHVGDNFLFGYFSGITHCIRKNVQDQTNFILPHRIRRVHLGAKNTESLTDFHFDRREADYFTLLGHIMPSWSPEWGGSIQIEDEEYPIEPGKFVVFPSNKYHDGKCPLEATPYWRISVNIIVGP